MTLHVDVLEDNLGFNLYRVALLFRRELMHALMNEQLTPEQWQVLVALETGRNTCSQSELLRLTLQDKHALSRTLDRMERDGWIRRRPHPTDGRATVVVRGARRPTVPEMQKSLKRQFASTNKILSNKERDELLRLLRKLRAALEASDVGSVAP